MITEKDREELKELTGKIRKTDQPVQWFDYGWNECAEIITEYVNKKRAESAEQARKEAADMAAKYVENLFIHGRIDPDELRAAILGDSAPVSTDSEKLAVAVKALEEISRTENSVATDFRNFIECLRISRSALNEIQK